MQAQDRSSLPGLTRTFGVSRKTVSSWIKKGAQQNPKGSSKIPGTHRPFLGTIS